ncbi:flagellar basal-body rod protein FlgF [Pleionea sediminis]|uniref:flagellar basal-body rod protein FlgF n=1 Tax=Pleionea sediminis TaxID=2569479 RepID=UPI00118510C8|nr:flagellar basal-body rod protein FlgF [Pleionea sediminis]
MLQSFFNGLSGMITFSHGLDSVSNNIANMNTLGYRGSDTFYSALNSGNSFAGVRAGGDFVNTTAGEISETGNATDLAVQGNGYFILRNEGEVFFTRAGNFNFDDDGFLVDRATGYRVAALDEFGNLTDINIDGMRQLMPEVTTQVNFSGDLSRASQTGEATVTVFNSLGEELELTFDFTNNTANTPGSWLVSIKDENDVEVGTGEIRFNDDGSPQASFNQFDITIPGLNNGTANTPLDLTLYFGEEGTLAATTSLSTTTTTSSINANIEDGRGVEGLVALSFNDKGEMNLLYSNGDTETPYRIALATFNNESSLIYSEGSLYKAPSNIDVEYGHADDGAFGTIAGESLESSNVDLVREFAEMIIIQRGYQASSRAMNIANQLVEQLYDNTRG